MNQEHQPLIGELAEIKIGQLYESATNPRKRFDETQLDELAESIKTRGIVQPLLVRPLDTNGTSLDPCYEIVDGARRFRAAGKVGASVLPCNVRHMPDQLVMEIQVVQHLNTAQLHPMEEARGYQQLADNCKLSVEEIARRVAKPRIYILRRLQLCALVPEAEKLFLAGKLSIETAQLVARVPQDLQPKVAREVAGVDDKLDPTPMGARMAKNHIENNYMLQLCLAPFDTKAEHLVSAAGACTHCPKRTGFNRDLFDDIPKSDDRCTDPACFKDKKKQHIILLKLKAKEDGRAVLAPDEAKAGWVDLDAPCPADPKGRPMRRILAGKIQPKDLAVVIDKTGKAHDVMTRDRMAEALKDAGVKVPKPEPVRDHAAERAKAEEEAAVYRAVADEFQIAVGDAAATLPTVEILRWLAELVMEWFSYEPRIRAAACRRFPKLERADDAVQALGEDIPKMSLREAKRLIAEMSASRDSEEDADFFCIDLKAIEKRVRADRAKTAAAKKPSTQKPAGK